MGQFKDFSNCNSQANEDRLRAEVDELRAKREESTRHIWSVLRCKQISQVLRGELGSGCIDHEIVSALKQHDDNLLANAKTQLKMMPSEPPNRAGEGGKMSDAQALMWCSTAIICAMIIADAIRRRP